jgi:hypothetical protein
MADTTSPSENTAAAEPQQQVPPPLTPLQVRQWQRAAQRSVRLALTAFKAGRTKAQEASDQGTAAATRLTNALLTAQHMPSMPLPEALQAVAGLKAAAVSKLARQQQAHLQELSAAVQQVADAVSAMEAALADVQAQLGQQQQQEHEPGGQHSPAPAQADAQCSRVPVFHALTLTQTAGCLRRVLDMHQQDLGLKRQVLADFADVVEAAAAAAGGSSSQADGAAQLRKRLTVLITCWMTNPHVDDEEAGQLLQVLTDEMTGF